MGWGFRGEREGGMPYGAEVGKIGWSCSGGEEKVGGFDISVNDALFVEIS